MTDGANIYRGFTEIQLGNETKRIRYTSEIFAEMEGHLPFKIGSLVREGITDADILATIGFGELRILIWGGLRGANGILAIKDVGKLMEATQFADNLRTVFKAIAAALGMTVEDTNEAKDETEAPATDPLAPIAKPLESVKAGI